MCAVNLEDNIKIAQLLGNISALRDHETNEHNIRVAYLSSLLGKKFNLNQQVMQGLMKGAFLHDIGKIGIPDKILLKKGTLSPEEWTIMAQHPEIGVNLIREIKWFRDAQTVILHHHEKFDGSGYPHGHKGNEIALNARIFAVIDVFDALVSKRPYKQSYSLKKSLKIIKKGRGTHFDPQVVDTFLPCAKQFYSIITKTSKNKLKNKLIKRRGKVFGL